MSDETYTLRLSDEEIDAALAWIPEPISLMHWDPIIGVRRKIEALRGGHGAQGDPATATEVDGS